MDQCTLPISPLSVIFYQTLDIAQFENNQSPIQHFNYYLSSIFPVEYQNAVRAIWECDNLGPAEMDKRKFKFIVDTLKSVRHYSHLDHIVLQRLKE